MGAGDVSPVEAASFAFSSSSVKVVNPQPVWLRSMISVVPSTRVETTSSARTSSVTAGPPVRITSRSACGNPRISGRFERRGSMHVTTAILGAGRCPSFGSCRFAYARFALIALSIIFIVHLQTDLARLPALVDAQGLLHRIALTPDENVVGGESLRPLGRKGVDTLHRDAVDVVIEDGPWIVLV